MPIAALRKPNINIVNSKVDKADMKNLKKRVYRIASLFSGSGGMDLGFKDAGFEIIWANDVNHWSCETFKKNFADYGAPQLRQRVLIIGVRNDLNKEFKLPAPTHTPENYITAREALKGVEKISFNNENQNIAPSTVAKLRLIPPGGNFTDIPKNSPHYVKGMISHVYRRLHPDKPSTTIIAGGGAGTWGYHYKENR